MLLPFCRMETTISLPENRKHIKLSLLYLEYGVFMPFLGELYVDFKNKASVLDVITQEVWNSIGFPYGEMLF